MEAPAPGSPTNTAAPAQDGTTLPSRLRWWLFPLLLLCVLGGVLVLRNVGVVSTLTDGRQIDATIATASAPVSGESVSLAIDFGNGAERRFSALSWQQEMTVLSLMDSAAEFRPGTSFRHAGSGPAAFVTHIEGIAAQEAEEVYWQFWVNGKHADRSCGVYELQPGDHVLWKLAPQQ